MVRIYQVNFLAFRLDAYTKGHDNKDRLGKELLSLYHVRYVSTMAEIKDGIEDAGKKLKASVKAAASKVKDPDKDLEVVYINRSQQIVQLPNCPDLLLPPFHSTRKY
jgi:hypothetical protein